MCVNVIFLRHPFFFDTCVVFFQFHSVALYLNNFYCYREWIKFSNADGTNKIIAKGNDCLVRTNRCFSKDPSDVVGHVRTRLMIKKEPCVSQRAFNKYFKEKVSSFDQELFREKKHVDIYFCCIFLNKYTFLLCDLQCCFLCPTKTMSSDR